LPILFFLLILAGNVFTQAGGLSAGITEEELEDRIQLVESSVDLSDSVRALVLEQYRQAKAHLALARSHEERKEALQEAFRRMAEPPGPVDALRPGASARG
jgi:hypothetical protein